MTHLDPAAAENCHYSTDPRIRHLAEAAWRMRTGGSRMDWLCLGKDNPEALISEAREWARAAVAAGIIPPPSSNPEWKNAAWDAANADDSADGAVSGYQTREEYEDRQALHAAIAVVERRWPDSVLLRELREQAGTVSGVAEERSGG